MNLLLGPALRYIAGGLLLALVVTSIGWKVQTGRLATAKDERDAARAEVTRLVAAVAGKDNTITALQSSVDAWKKLATPGASVDAAAARVDQAAQMLEARAKALTTAEGKDREKPDCAALLALDIARMCPAIAAGVRQRAAHRVPGPAGGSAGAGGPENP